MLKRGSICQRLHFENADDTITNLHEYLLDPSSGNFKRTVFTQIRDYSTRNVFAVSVQEKNKRNEKAASPFLRGDSRKQKIADGSVLFLGNAESDQMLTSYMLLMPNYLDLRSLWENSTFHNNPAEQRSE